MTAAGQASVTPDMAVVSFAVTGTGKELGATRDEVNARSSSVLARLRELGIAQVDLNAPDVMVQPDYDYQEGQRLIGYRVVRQMVASVRDLDRLGDVLDGVVGAGSNEVHGAQMKSSDPSAAEHEALRQATAAGRAKAVVLAEAAGVALGDVMRIEEVLDVNGPPMQLRLMAATEAADMQTEVAIGDQMVTCHIQAWFAIE